MGVDFGESQNQVKIGSFRRDLTEIKMEGQEIAFWLMMGFSCLIGVFIGYLMFSPRRSSVRGEDQFDSQQDSQHFSDDDEGLDAFSAQLNPDTVPAPEPWLTDKETLREQARERALARMTEHATRVKQESAAQESAAARHANEQPTSKTTKSAGADDPAQPFFDPDTIKEWDQVSPKSARRKPGTWVKATTD